MENQYKPVFVTGGTGLLGSHLIFTLISQGEQVRAIHRKTSNRETLEKVIGYYKGDTDKLLNLVEWIECDICDYDRLEQTMLGVEIVYHCAAAVSFENRNKDYVLDNNIKGTSNIVKACFANKIRKLCHVSSISALGAYDGEAMVNETHSWDEAGYRSPYGTSKYLSEKEVWKGISNGLNAGLLFYTSGTNGYVDVNDVVKAMITLMRNNISGERFIVNGENLTYDKFFGMIARSLKVWGPFIKVPKLLSYLALPLVSVLEIFSKGKTTLTMEMLKVAWSRITYDNSKLIKRTGFSYTPIERTVQVIGEIFLQEKIKMGLYPKSTISP
jgi:dihydroflavonol-4-reductase